MRARAVRRIRRRVVALVAATLGTLALAGVANAGDHRQRHRPIFGFAALAASPPADTDGEAVPNSTDNCPTVPDASQADLDSDGQGNT